MKYLIVLVSVIFALDLTKSNSALMDLIKNIENTMEKCMKKHEVSQAQMKTFIYEFQMPLDKNVQCAFACVAKEMNIMKNDNTFDGTNITNVLKPLAILYKDTPEEQKLYKKLNEIIDICIFLQKSIYDECIAANNGFICIISNAKKNGLIPNRPN